MANRSSFGGGRCEGSNKELDLVEDGCGRAQFEETVYAPVPRTVA